MAFINPLNLLGLGSSGFNPLAALDPASPHFFLQATEDGPYLELRDQGIIHTG